MANPGSGGQRVLGNQNVQISRVTGSTINVRIDGGPPRRVPLERAVVPPGRNASPARLLRARSGVLPFVDRAGLLSGLTEWMTSPDPFAGYLVGGRGGSGKTRLGVQLSVEAGQREWLCGLLSRTTDLAQLEVLAGTPTPRLVVIDYAESRGEQLEIVLPWLAEQATTEWPVRVLLLVRAAPRRSDDWTEPLRGRGDWLDAVLDDVQLRVLDDLPPTPGERAALFGSAATAFAARAQPDAVPGTVAVPEPSTALAGPAFTSPLLISVAAYLAVQDPDGRMPTSRTDLLTELMTHEDRHWQATAGAYSVELGGRMAPGHGASHGLSRSPSHRRCDDGWKRRRVARPVRTAVGGSQNFLGRCIFWAPAVSVPYSSTHCSKAQPEQAEDPRYGHSRVA